jgi:hypothetical protein
MSQKYVCMGQPPSIGHHRAAATRDCPFPTHWLGLDGADLIDYPAVRIKKRQTRDPVGCDL